MPEHFPLDARLSGIGLASTLLQAVRFGAAVIDTGLRFRAVNGPLAEMDGVPAAEHVGRCLDEVLPPELGAQLGSVIRNVLASGTAVVDFPLQAPFPAGRHGYRHGWLLSCHPVWNEGCEPGGVLLTARDPAPEQAALAGLPEAEALVSRVLDSLFAFVGVLDLDGTLREINRAPLEAAGVRKQDVVGLKLWDCPWWRHDPDMPSRLREYRARAAQGERVRAEVTACTMEGRLVPLDFMLAPLRDPQGRITHLVNSAIDISERKRSEEALRASAVLFRSVVESAPNGLAMVNAQGRITLLNGKMADLFGYGRDELLGRPIELLVPPVLHEAQREQRVDWQAARAAHAGQREFLARRKDGSLFPVEIGLMPVDAPEGPQTIAAVVDVSDHKQAQHALECALRQKTALLHEVHHRVKNNLQVISSLLTLQARSAGPEAREVLAESQSRVKAMALTHQLLYEREDFSNVHMGLYLQRLVELLRQGHAGGRRDIEVVVDVGGEELLLDLQRALPCALLVTELVINVFKHAFPDKRPGCLAVLLRREGEGAVIEVSDNGIGIPPSLEMGRAQSLGFQLLPMLADQIGAQLTLRRDHGSHFTIRLPLDRRGEIEREDSGNEGLSR